MDDLQAQVEADRQERWQRGVEQRPNPAAWHGKTPLRELYDEALDSLNYLEEHERQTGESLRALHALAAALAGGILRKLRRQEPA